MKRRHDGHGTLDSHARRVPGRGERASAARTRS
jgi:hypothetical protein